MVAQPDELWFNPFTPTAKGSQMSYQPSEHQIRATMERIGCDYLQARNHLIGAQRVRELAERQSKQRYAAAVRALTAQVQ